MHFGREQLCVDGRPVVPIVDGAVAAEHVDHHLIVPLYDALAVTIARAKAERPTIYSGILRRGVLPQELQPLTVEAPPDLSFGRLIDILYTAGRAGFTQYYLGVQGAEGRGALVVSPPMFTGTTEPPPDVKLFILDDGMRVGVGAEIYEPGGIGLANPTLPRHQPSRWDLAALTKAIEELAKAHPEIHDVTISAENDIPLGVLVAVIDVAAGDDCPAKPRDYDDAIARCRLPFVTIEAGAG
ncbi:MAG: hypothetical protein KDK70_11390 [Myxococcales bacterium]|nr:hypothetical protein [Myxococcales bacterium]